MILTSLEIRGYTNNSKRTSMCCLISQFTLHASGCRTFPTTKKKSCYVGLEKQTVPVPTQQTMPAPTEQKVPHLLSKLYLHLRSKQYPYLLSKQGLHPRSKKYPTYSVNCSCTYGANYPHLLSNQKVLAGLAIMVFSLCYTRC